MTVHLTQFSTGAGSAEVALRVHATLEPGDQHVLITADTRVEDADNWRFAFDAVALMPGVQWIVLADGRTPMQAGRDSRCVPNNRMAVCSRVLKRELVRAYLDEHYDPADSVVYLGYDWTEDHRLTEAIAPWAPWTVRCPLMEAPYVTKAAILDAWAARGIAPPRLYAAGFSHANCGGACVRGGQEDWGRLLFWNRDRYMQWEADEEETRAMLGRDVTILRDRRTARAKDGIAMSLAEFRARLERDPSLFDMDGGACGCDPWSA